MLKISKEKKIFKNFIFIIGCLLFVSSIFFIFGAKKAEAGAARIDLYASYEDASGALHIMNGVKVSLESRPYYHEPSSPHYGGKSNMKGTYYSTFDPYNEVAPNAVSYTKNTDGSMTATAASYLTAGCQYNNFRIIVDHLPGSFNVNKGEWSKTAGNYLYSKNESGAWDMQINSQTAFPNNSKKVFSQSYDFLNDVHYWLQIRWKYSPVINLTNMVVSPVSGNRNINDTVGAITNIYREIDATNASEAFKFRVTATNTGLRSAKFRVIDDLGQHNGRLFGMSDPPGAKYNILGVNVVSVGGSTKYKWNATPALGVPGSANGAKLWQGTLNVGGTLTLDYTVELTDAAKTYYTNEITESDYDIIFNEARIDWIEGWYNENTSPTVDYGGHGTLKRDEPVEVYDGIEKNPLSCTLDAIPESGTLPLIVGYIASGTGNYNNLDFALDLGGSEGSETLTDSDHDKSESYTHTYTVSDTYNPTLTLQATDATTGVSRSIDCLNSFDTIKVNPWSDNDTIEIAP